MNLIDTPFEQIKPVDYDTVVTELQARNKMLVSVVERMITGLKWYGDACPQLHSPADDEMIAEAKKAIKRTDTK